MDPHARYPALSDLRARARHRMPRFVWEFLDSATGDERTKARNRAALDAILFHPSVLHGDIAPDLGTPFLGQDFALPIKGKYAALAAIHPWWAIIYGISFYSSVALRLCKLSLC